MPGVELCAICLKPIVDDDWWMIKLEDNAGKLVGQTKAHRKCLIEKVMLADEVIEETS